MEAGVEMHAYSLLQVVSDAVYKSSGVEKTVLIVLLFCSVISWALILYKMRLVKRTTKDNDRFVDMFEKAEHTGEVLKKGATFSNASMYTTFKAGMATMKIEKEQVKTVLENLGEDDLPLKTDLSLGEKVCQAMQHAARVEYGRMFDGMDVLASIGSSSPFIGLFGTVWGIMGTFQTLAGVKSASLQYVAPGIASALIATAAGLFVAIPAVIGYNRILARMDELQEKMNCFIERVILLLQASGKMKNASAADDRAKT
jgi:biopolymer transport protein TolQ